MNVKSTLFLLFIFTLSSLLYSCSQSNQQQDYRISWKIADNKLNPNQSVSELVIANLRGRTLKNEGWTLYFNYIRTIKPESVTGGVDVKHINGDFYKIAPTENFKAVVSGDSATISFAANGISIKESDAPSGFYFVFDNQSISNVGSVDVTSIAVESLYEQYKNLSKPNSEYYFDKYDELTSLPKDSVSKITPKPKYITPMAGTFLLDKQVSIAAPKALQKEAKLLSSYIQEHSSVQPAIAITEESVENNSADIILTIDKIELQGDQLDAEAYDLNISDARIQLKGSDAAGVFYGIQSLKAWMENSDSVQAATVSELPAVHIIDAPRFGYRGFHLDVARNFQSQGTVKRLLDVMAIYKLNTFHFHLTDDEGWRIAIDGLPELTEVGGKRGQTLKEDNHLMPSYGSGPYPDTGATGGSGWYTREEFIDLLQFAGERHIKIIPEIDLPGHARAAIVAMEARYDQTKSDEYRLTDPGDESQYRSVQGWNDNVINVCRESSYHFIETVFDDLISMYKEAGAPLHSIHVGGDEVPSGVWEKSPICNDLIAASEDLEKTPDLPNYFFGNVQKMLSDRGLIMSGWQEVALDHHAEDEQVSIKKELKGKVRPYVWLNIWGSGTEDYAYRLANEGFDVVMAQANMLYFDMAYDHRPAEPGFYWAAFIDDRDPFRFMPMDLFKNGIQNQFGQPIPDSYFNEMTQLTEMGREHVIGLQGQLWGETLTKNERVEYMALPRLLSLAERAWAEQPEWALADTEKKRLAGLQADWNEFTNRLGRFELQRLDQRATTYQYHLSVPGITEIDGNIHMNTQFPGVPIRYTTDGSTPDASSTVYEQPFQYKPQEVIKARVFSSQNRGGRVSTYR